jgi:hypothetical protein
MIESSIQPTPEGRAFAKPVVAFAGELNLRPTNDCDVSIAKAMERQEGL